MRRSSRPRTAKQENYRHAGTDLKTSRESNGNFKITIDQDAYVESVADIDINPQRLRSDGPLTKEEAGARRPALGALQWLAIQTQPQLCARCNILLTEVVTTGTLETACEIQSMIAEVRAEAVKLKFFKLPDCKSWKDPGRRPGRTDRQGRAHVFAVMAHMEAQKKSSRQQRC